ncbi:MAG: creatininase family protein [Xanthobacteraceae bacterium]
MIPKRHWADMSWAEIAAADTTRWIAILPVAAVEQHGPHLPLATDALIGEAYLSRVLRLAPSELPVTALPPLTIGLSTEHRAFPGTLSFSTPTAIGALTEIAGCVHRAGVKKLVIVTSHGGNVEVSSLVARDLRARFRMVVVSCGWSTFGYPEGLFTDAEVGHGIHGGDIETSLMLAYRPDLVAMPAARDATPTSLSMKNEFIWLGPHGPAAFGWMTQDLHASGAVGDAREASAEKGEAALAHGARAFIALLQELDRFDPGRLAAGPLD